MDGLLCRLMYIIYIFYLILYILTTNIFNLLVRNSWTFSYFILSEISTSFIYIDLIASTLYIAVCILAT